MSYQSTCSSSFGPMLYHHMLSAVILSQSTVSSSGAAKPSVPFGGWYRGQEASMWSAVYSAAPQLQFAKGIKSHLCIVERNSTTLIIRRRFSLTQEGLSRIISGGEGPGDGINVWRREVFFCHSVFRPESCSGINGLI